MTGTGDVSLLVNSETRDIPVGVLEVSRVLVDMINASLGASGRINVSGPVSAKCKVDNQILISEVSLEVARVVHEVGVGSSPVSRVDRASSVLNVIGDGGIVSRPEPQIDLVCSPFGGVPSSSVGIKRRTIVICLVHRDTAAGVSVDLPIAIGSSERASL